MLDLKMMYDNISSTFLNYQGMEMQLFLEWF